MERRHVLMFDSRGYARVIEASRREVYFDSIFVKEAHRRLGIATELLQFAISHFGRYPELDIRYQSLVAQRIAAKFRYVRVAVSRRYEGCYTWRHQGTARPGGQSMFEVQSLRTYRGASRTTIVYYLRMTNGSNHPLQPTGSPRG